MIPQKIGRYEVKSELGRGGMATVFHARDPRFERDVAVKVLPREFLHDPTFRARFEREAKTIAALEHSAIVPVHDFGEDEGQPYLVMRYMPGGSLAEWLEKGPLPVAEAAKVLQRIGDALDRAHSRGIIHRDLKPGNILFDQYGDSYLADFGIVKLTQQTATFTGTGIIGTPAYMSPEQAKGDANLDGRSDIYALGAILFEMLTGKQPYQADTPMGLAVKHILEPVPRILEIKPDLPPGCATVISRAMAKEPAQRFSRATELIETLRQSASGTSVVPDLAGAAAQVISPTFDKSFESGPGELTPEAATILSKQELVQPRPAGSRKKRWLPILLTALGWSFGLLIGGIIATFGAGLVAGAIGGLSTGLVLRRLESFIGWKQLLAVTIGWFVGFGLVFAGIDAQNPCAGLIGIAIGAGVIALVLQRGKVSVRRKEVIIIIVGWIISYLIASIFAAGLAQATANQAFALMIAGAVFGAIGGGVMFRQLGRADNRP